MSEETQPAAEPVADNKVLQAEVRKLRARTDALEAALAELQGFVTPHGIRLTSLDGTREIYMKAENHGAGIWVGHAVHDMKHPCVAIYTGYGNYNGSAVVGTWAAHDKNQPTRGIDACLFADTHGHLQMTSPEGHVNHFDTKDFGR